MLIKIHMKSGKTLVQRGVKDTLINYNNTQITFLDLELYSERKRTIIMAALDLASIEGITQH